MNQETQGWLIACSLVRQFNQSSAPQCVLDDFATVGGTWPEYITGLRTQLQEMFNTPGGILKNAIVKEG